MREITTHKLPGVNDKLKLVAVDTNHHYLISFANEDGDLVDTNLRFQNGPLQEAGVNGITHEVLLAILIDRIEEFQKTDFVCRENAIALTKLQEALHWLNHRTFQRVRRGVEGMLVP